MGLEQLARDFISGKNQKIVSAYKGKSLILCATGRTLWDDLAQVNDPNADIMCVNHAGLFVPGKIEHWYSDHTSMLHHWRELRLKMRPHQTGAMITHSATGNGAVQHIWPWPRHGTSTLGAVYTGLALGYDPIYLCGAPLDNSGHFYDPPGGKTNFSNEVANRNGMPKFWTWAARNVFDGRVKVFSGRLKAVIDGFDSRAA